MGRSKHVISIKSRRPRRRFSLVPHGERSGRLRSRRPRGSLKFPLPSRRLHASTQLSSLGAASFVASPRCCWSSFSQARPPIRYGAPTLPPRAAAPPFWLAWGSRSKASSSSTASSTATLSLSQHRFGARVYVPLRRSAFKLRAFRRWCRTCSVLAALPSWGGGHLPAAIGAAPPLSILIHEFADI